MEITESDIGRWCVTREGGLLQIIDFFPDDFPVVTEVANHGEDGQCWDEAGDGWQVRAACRECPLDLIRFASEREVSRWIFQDVTSRELIRELAWRHGNHCLDVAETLGVGDEQLDTTRGFVVEPKLKQESDL